MGKKGINSPVIIEATSFYLQLEDVKRVSSTITTTISLVIKVIIGLTHVMDGGRLIPSTSVVATLV